MKTVIWHNPRCSKSRAALKLLEENGIEHDVRRYLEDVPTAAEIRDVLTALDLPAISLVRTGEKVFKENGLSRDSGDDALVKAMAAHPILIERPVVMSGQKAAIGRPPEAVLGLF